MRQKKLYKELIQKDIDALTSEKSNSIKKHNIQDILNNIGAIFTSAYLHYKEVPKETMSERSIAERLKLRKERLTEIKRKEENINNQLFNYYFSVYRNPSSMYEKLSEAKNAEINQDKVDLIKKVLSKLQKVVDYAPKDNPLKI